MRALLILALLSTPALAERPRPTFIDVGMKQRGPVMVPASSRIVYLHRCPPAGCPIIKGQNDDSRQNISQIAGGNTVIGAFTQSDDTWKKMLSCVRATFAPFDVMITDVDPGPQTSHYEHIVGGRPGELRPDIGGAGGVAPATCTEIPNAMSFTFDVYGDDFETLCWTASQEVAHAFGLEHVLNARDPLTYLSGFLPKRFQAADAQCGEGIPRTCMCTGNTQNSYMHMLAMFGPGTPTPPTLMVKSPTNNKKLQPGFITRVDASDDSGLDHVEILIDGTKIADSYEAPYTIIAPDVVEAGPHTLEVRAVDIQGTPTSVMLDVTMGPPCTASAGCDGVDVCVAGVCVPGPDAAGGLGYECSASTECISRSCVKDGGSFGHCTEACNPAVEGVCPSGFDCIDAGGGAGVCWPGASGGCCDAGGSGKGAALLGFGVLALVLRRRRGR
ncbi:MAG: Ig-like domain-containing protein [Myxococcota bacterium]|nr:Ig-like domain-containing protein [Myxococcota bacterium]